MNTDRDKEICKQYVGGMKVNDLADQNEISPERVRQILRKAGVFRKDPVVARTGRNAFLGVMVTKDEKAFLKEVAEKRGLSVSALTSDMIKKLLEEHHGASQHSSHAERSA